VIDLDAWDWVRIGWVALFGLVAVALWCLDWWKGSLS